ncbi:fumarylacetoacetate hydrolase family protein [bacterium LRH843]|nr:fumarylacetoacetate hydrolase family protein [bacterium LRH843]
MNIKNIFCIGRNYAKHAYELGNDIPEEQIMFVKPTHSLVYTGEEAVFLPKDKGEVHHELEIILYISRDVEKGDKVDDVVSYMALGIDLTLRDVQSKLKKEGRPWLRAKGFKQSAITTPFWAFEGVESCKEADFTLTRNGEVVQKANIKDMIFDFQAIIDECVEWFGLKEGDIIYTGTPEGVGPLKSGDECVLYWGEEEKGRITFE